MQNGCRTLADDSLPAKLIPAINPPGAEPVDYPDKDRIPAAIHGPSSSLHGIVVCVTGLGVSGYPMAVHLAERGAEVIVVDANTDRDESEHEAILQVFDVDIRRGSEHVAEVPRTSSGRLPDLVCTSPGWRPDQPLLADAAARNIPIIGEVELAWRVRGANSAPWLVVTGTNGKTTTTSMLDSMLRAQGLQSRACGNIGSPLLEAVLDPEAEVLAIELSSFQLHWQFSMAAHSAAVLNLADDHLDWHGGWDGYVADKAKAYSNVQLACVYSCEDLKTRTLVEEAEVIEGARAVGFGLGTPRVGELGVVEDVLADRAFAERRQTSAQELGSLEDVALASGTPGMQPADHQVLNALAAAALARSIGVEPAAVRDGLRQHRVGEHRSAVVAQADGITWIDDSKATNPHAAAAALSAHDSIVWIAGGLAKGADFSDLVGAYADRIRTAVVIGTDSSSLIAALEEHGVPYVVLPPSPDGLEEEPRSRGRDVMERAVAEAEKHAQLGDTVLLAPASASMDQFLNYATRGELFADAVRGALS